MTAYQIIDEPNTKHWAEKLIVDPTIILFAAILVPLFWQPPLMGRFWMPMIWLVFNGYALGSHTLMREIGTLLAGTVVWVIMWATAFKLINTGIVPFALVDVYPYLRILEFGVFFMTLYLVVFRQGSSYALFQYRRGDA